MFFIKKLELTTIDDVKSYVYFTPGLNIIYGESNTGKSLVLDCIDYLLGAKEHRFDNKLKIQSVTLLLDVRGKEVSLSRKIDSNEIEVVSKISEIKSDVYKLYGKKCINSVWLKLMGIKDDTKILMTLGGRKQRFTVRTICHTFLIDETRIQGTSSILASGSGTNKNVATSTLTALLYMATGKNYITDELSDDNKTKKIKYAAVKEFVERSLEDLEKTKERELCEQDGETPEILQKKIDKILEDLGATEERNSKLLSKSQKLAKEITKIDSKITEYIVLKDRNSNLLTQYESDIRRLTFIAEGDIYNESIPVLDVCPFCDGQLSQNQSESCINAAFAEVQKIETQIKDVKSVQVSIEKQIEELYIERTAVVREREKIEMVILRKLKPQIKILKTNLQDYAIALSKHKAVELINTLSSVLNKELKDIDVEASRDIVFDLRAKIEEVFVNKLEEELKALLTECNYPKFANVTFDLNDYDVVVDQHKKSTQGQGFRALLNTALAISIKNVLDKYHNYQYPVMVIDSPVLSLKENEDAERIGDTMKIGLFKYFVKYQNGPQMIVIENEIPKIDYEDTNLIKFTKNKENGRYGLIEGYTE